MLLVWACWVSPTIAAAAKTQGYEIIYDGFGHYSSSTTVPIACGDQSRDEVTKFSWIVEHHISLTFGAHGFAAVKSEEQPEINPLLSNDSEIKLFGCAGNADCTGLSEPAPGERIQLTLTAAAPGGRSRLTAWAVGTKGFTGMSFGGPWSQQGGDCSSYVATSNPELLVEEFALFHELEASFPIMYSTLRSLPRGHHFKVDISAGHYASHHVNFCFKNDGCDAETFKWQGTVTVRRTS